MDISTTLWLSELEMDDDPMIVNQQRQMMNSDLEEFTYSTHHHPVSLSPQINTPPLVDSSSMSTTFFRSGINSTEETITTTTPAAKMLKTTNTTLMNQKPSSAPSSTPTIIYFQKAISKSSTTAQYSKRRIGAPNYNNIDGDYDDNDLLLGYINNEGSKKSSSNATRNQLQAQDHVIAERQRRERLSKMFIQLSSLVPGLKKIDKASVLGEAANYIQQLQERVKTLEEKVVERDGEAIGSAVNRSGGFYFDEESSSSGDDSTVLAADCHNYIKSTPEIEVRISERNVFLRIQSNILMPGFAVRILSDVEKLHMTIISSSVMPFSDNSLLITVIAQMNMEFCMTANDLMKRLQLVADQMQLRKVDSTIAIND